MSKLYRVKDWILLSAGFSAEVLQEIRFIGDFVPNLMEGRYGFIPPNFKKRSYLSDVSRLLKTGDITKKVDKKGNAYLELTSRGKGSLKRRFPIFSKGNYDGSFMVVIFDVPETERRIRDDLRERLREIGFGKLQESVWVSPYHFEDDLREFLDANSYLDYVFVMKATRVLGKSIRTEANQIWKLNEINSRYKKIAARATALLDGNKDIEEAKKVWREYFEVLAVDPFLPTELLPKDWSQKEAYKALSNLNPGE